MCSIHSLIRENQVITKQLKINDEYSTTKYKNCSLHISLKAHLLKGMSNFIYLALLFEVNLMFNQEASI